MADNIISMYDDENDWMKFLNGNEAALSRIYHKYHDNLFLYGVRFTKGSFDQAEDAIQDLFLKLWKNRKQLPRLKSVKAYLFRSYKTTLIDLVVKGSKTEASDNISSSEITFSKEDIIINEEIDEHNRKKLFEAINSLPPRHREILYMKFFEDMSYPEIQEALDLKYQTVRSTVYESIKILKGKLTSAQLIYLLSQSLTDL